MNLPKIAVAYDWADSMGGVERLLTQLFRIYPHAELFTSIHSPKALWTRGVKVNVSFMQRLPAFIRNKRILSLPLFPFAFESFNLNGYDAVISVSSSFAKGVITRPETRHISIVLTPTRYLWELRNRYTPSIRARALGAPVSAWLRSWDYIAAQRPDTLLAISKKVAARCRKIYRRTADVVYPPFDRAYWEGIIPEPAEFSRPYYLVVSRLEPYKAVQMVLDAFAELPSERLVIVGAGSRLNSLKARAPANATFLGTVTDEQLAGLYMGASALIMPQEEDFGYTALEALFFNCPVITYAKSGAAEIVEDGQTGLFFREQSRKSLIAALARSVHVPYNVPTRREAILSRFSFEKFRERIEKELAITPPSHEGNHLCRRHRDSIMAALSEEKS